MGTRPGISGALRGCAGRCPCPRGAIPRQRAAAALVPMHPAALGTSLACWVPSRSAGMQPGKPGRSHQGEGRRAARVPIPGPAQPRDSPPAPCVAVTGAACSPPLSQIRRIRRCLARCCGRNRQLSWRRGEPAPRSPFLASRHAGFWMAVAFPWKAQEAVRKRSYIEAHLQSPVKWIQQCPAHPDAPVACKGRCPGVGSNLLKEPESFAGTSPPQRAAKPSAPHVRSLSPA